MSHRKPSAAAASLILTRQKEIYARKQQQQQHAGGGSGQKEREEDKKATKRKTTPRGQLKAKPNAKTKTKHKKRTVAYATGGRREGEEERKKESVPTPKFDLVLRFFRHAQDSEVELPPYNQPLDPDILPSVRESVRRKGAELTKRGIIPIGIIYSPFLRCKQTATELVHGFETQYANTVRDSKLATSKTKALLTHSFAEPLLSRRVPDEQIVSFEKAIRVGKFPPELPLREHSEAAFRTRVLRILQTLTHKFQKFQQEQQEKDKESTTTTARFQPEIWIVTHFVVVKQVARICHSKLHIPKREFCGSFSISLNDLERHLQFFK